MSISNNAKGVFTPKRALDAVTTSQPKYFLGFKILRLISTSSRLIIKDNPVLSTWNIVVCLRIAKVDWLIFNQSSKASKLSSPKLQASSFISTVCLCIKRPRTVILTTTLLYENFIKPFPMLWSENFDRTTLCHGNSISQYFRRINSVWSFRCPTYLHHAQPNVIQARNGNNPNTCSCNHV